MHHKKENGPSIGRSSGGLIASLAALLLVAAACAGNPPPSNPGPLEPGPHNDLRPGDGVRVDIWREPELSGEFNVNQDGYLVLPLLGERRVRGVSSDALRDQLRADYREYLENPSVDVTVLRRVSILGEVRNPGVYAVDPTMTLVEAVAAAGGLAPSGNQDDIRVVRGGEIVRRSLDAEMTVGASAIRSGDQIVVGKRRGVDWRLVISGVAVTTSLIALLAR